jgi:RNA polymerase sigma factor (sigma-70 family)
MAAYYAHHSGEDVDDLAQEAWLGLLEALPELDLDIGQPEQYLIARARWRMLDTIKRERVRRCVPLDDGLTEATCHAPDDIVTSACASEFASHLKSTQRAVLGCLLSGLTWREAGEHLGCASANIAYHVRKIRRRYEEWI